jgi:tetratricopeptide (TPR) repeat protein
LTFGCLVTISASSQNLDGVQRRVDSLKTLLNSKDLQVVYESEFGIAYELFDVDNNTAVKFGCKAYAEAARLGDTAKIVKAGRLCAQLLRRVDRADSAALTFSQVLPLAEALRDSTELGKILNAMAVLYNYQGSYDKALVINLRALRLRKALNDTANIVGSLENTGVIYYKMENAIEAERFYQEAYSYLNGRPASRLLLNHSLNRLALRDFSGFRSLSEEALQVADVEELPSIRMGYNFGFGLYHSKRGRYDSALEYYAAGLQNAQGLGDVRMAAECRLGLSEVFLNMSKYDVGLDLLEGLEVELSGGRHDPLVLRYFDLMSTLLEHKGRLAESLSFRNRYRALNDSIYSRKVANSIMMAKVRFEEEQNELTIARQAEVISLKQAVINKQRGLLLISIVLAAALLSLAIVLYKFSRYQRSIAQDLNLKVADRTKDLQASELRLLSCLREQRAMMELVAARLRASMATVSGLRVVATLGSAEDQTSHNFEEVVLELQQISLLVDHAGRGPTDTALK